MDRQSSLERQVRRAAFGLAMLVVVTLGTVAIMTAIYSMQGNLVASQNAALKILAGNIQTTLNRQIEAMHELSINPLVWTAISDTVGRESYLRPYLRNLNAASAGINNIALFDYRGRPISGETNSSDVVQGNLKSFIESILRSGKPALTVNQDGMPVMDGYEATRTIREWEREMGKPPLPVIALTADAFEDDRQHALNAGMDDFLTKPISMKALQSVLMQWLRQKDASCDTLTPSRTIDVDRINVILQELLPLLAANRFDAISLFNDLRAEVSGTLVSEALAVIGNHLEQLNFSACLAQLRQVAQQEGWRAPS